MKKLFDGIKKTLRNGPIGIYLFAGLIPLNDNFLGFTVLVIILEQLIRTIKIDKAHLSKQLSWRNPGIWLLSFYLLHVVGLIHTENMQFATMDLGMKSTIAIFPIFFMLYKPKVVWNRFVKCFILGAFIAIAYNSFQSYLIYIETGHPHHFTGSYLSHVMHRGYWAVYLLIAYFFMLRLIIAFTSKTRLLLNVFGALILGYFIVLTESRLGLIGLLIVSFWQFIVFSISIKKRWLIPVFIVVISGMFLFVYQTMPHITKRVDKTVLALKTSNQASELTPEKTDARLLLWGSSLELIKENFWFGVGTGDVKDEFVKRNKEKGYSKFVELRFNSHNQFFNVHIALGVFGVVFLLMVFVTNILKKKEDPYRAWRLGIVFILFIALIPESMIESQAGIIPYAFLLSFLTAFTPVIYKTSQQELKPLEATDE
ncbi:hypothetical protein CW751_07435 [Brumimicrobium salinarum]|uniref:O-antigen ligase-related domain-containing protein n=1 Tax=Brumimicrobium salinarum TaxID=2058658 RepID=A0A2I0R3L0_9FLAO|nr:O-antigen ligase family protein [Brumimicrobium salinarum]PKR80990.1 hypothetical protein CW751_07435 [Brumimicrobium salinarum]